MSEFLVKNLSAVIAFLAMLVSLAAVIYARANIKTQKYIETITSQRITWVETLRLDLSEIITGLHLLSYCKGSINDYWEFVENVGFEDPEDDEKGSEHIAKLKVLEEGLQIKVSRIELIQKIDLSILRLNSRDDAELINQLEEVRELILKEKYDLRKDPVRIKLIREKASETLKNEWEKIKLETMKGRLVNDKRQNSKNIFS